ncbi:MAG: hypothetical protein IK119_03935 [Bacteroidales bacterium]|nr:hypothetical protein [Bacteroidales bacterium]
MKASIFLLLALGVVACGTVRPVTGVDSTKVEVHTETRYVHDTAYVELPVIIEKVATLDTTSTLENTYAKSEAVVANGILRHSLETKPVSVPVKVETKEVVRDSIVFRDRVQTQTVEVEKKLNWWQKLKLKAGGFFLILTLIGIVYIIVNLFVKPKLFSL